MTQEEALERCKAQGIEPSLGEVARAMQQIGRYKRHAEMICAAMGIDVPFQVVTPADGFSVVEQPSAQLANTAAIDAYQNAFAAQPKPEEQP